MKAIGCVIAYFKNHNNYGTSLQGFATIKAIEHEGYKCRLIQYQKSDSLFKKIRLAPLMFISGGWQAYKKKIKKKKIIKVAWTAIVIVMILSMVAFSIVPFLG